jgi:hypothetical protein
MSTLAEGGALWRQPMSRYRIPAHDPRYEVVVGWDSPLETFFCQIFDTTVDEDDETYCVLWEGMTFQSISTLDMLQTHVSQFATIPEAICIQLRSDQEHATPRSPLQNRLLRLFQ